MYPILSNNGRAFAVLSSRAVASYQPLTTSFLRWNSTATNSEALDAKRQLDEYFKYYSTHKAIRPMIYRAKNSNKLLNMDLRDPETNEQIKTRKPIVPISKDLLNQYIKSVNKEGELFEWFKKWTSVSKRKKQLWNYVDAKHLQNLLVKSFFEIGDYARIVGFLYFKKFKFVDAKNIFPYNIENFFNTIIMCNIHRNALNKFQDSELSLRKLLTAWKTTVYRKNETGLANLLVETLVKRQNIDLSKTTTLTTTLTRKELKLPNMETTCGKDASKQQIFLDGNENIYLICRTLQQFGTDVIENNYLSKISEFISEYQTASKKFKDEDIYDKYVESAKELYSESGKLNTQPQENKDEHLSEPVA